MTTPAPLSAADPGEALPGRALFALSGSAALPFLQGLVTNDLRPLMEGPGLVYAALLSPQGKYLADFFLARGAFGLLLDAEAAQAADLLARLALYRLRADVVWAPAPLFAQGGLGPAPADGFADPRDPGLGWRAYRPAPGLPAATDWAARRIALGIPAAGADLIPGESYILEAGFERLSGVDFRKGCYVGQEVTARMKHKTAPRRHLVRLAFDGPAPAPGSAITDAAGAPLGTLGSTAGQEGLALLRADPSTLTPAARLCSEAVQARLLTLFQPMKL